MKKNKAEKMISALAKECRSFISEDVYEYVYWKVFNKFEGKKMPPEYRDALIALKYNLGV